MTDKYYRIKVPSNEETNNFISSEVGSLVPKFNKKISFTASSDSNSITFTMNEITKGKDVAYPNGDSIHWRGKEYKLEKMTIFKGLYNDYSGIINTTDKDKAEVMLSLKNDNDRVYVFFLLSVKSVTKSGFFNIFANKGGDGKVVSPGTNTYTDKKVSILDIMPNNSKYVHIFNDITRKMNHKYTAVPEHSNSTVIIFSPSENGYKNIPMNDALGYIFADPKELSPNINAASMNTIKLNVGEASNIQCGGSLNDAGNYCNIGDKMQWKENNNAKTDDGQQSDVYLTTNTNRYSRLNNPFEMAHSIGGIGSVLTSCYEVEVDEEGDEIRHGEKHIPAYKDKYMIPQEYWFQPTKKLTEEEKKEMKAKAEKFWFQDGEPGFYILIVLGALIGFAILGYLVYQARKKWFPNAMKQQNPDIKLDGAE